MLYAKALAIAQELVTQFEPLCQRIEIAGSIRRQKPEPGDIEICAMPKLKPSGLFGDPVSVLEGFDYSKFGQIIKGGQRYIQLDLPEGIKLDLFLVLPPAQWGVIFALRTGPDSFSRKCVTQRCKGGMLPSYLRVEHGAVWEGETLVPTPDESDFFRVLELDWIPPQQRR